LLLDEPFAALDPASREELLGDFLPIVKESKITTVFVTHDREEGFALAEQVGVFQEGHLLQLGPRADVFFRPNSAAVAEIVGMANRLWGTIEASDGDLATVRIDEQIVRVTGTFQTGAKVLLCVRPENILVKRSDGAIEGLNRLRATIVTITAAITHHRIALACGSVRLIAIVDRTAFLEAGYREGESVVAVFSPSAVHAVIENHAARSTALPTQ
jgi:ABC-type Fe3+/spermidine/putrescine transport system ATPase subunit